MMSGIGCNRLKGVLRRCMAHEVVGYLCLYHVPLYDTNHCAPKRNCNINDIILTSNNAYLCVMAYSSIEQPRWWHRCLKL